MKNSGRWVTGAHLRRRGFGPQGLYARRVSKARGVAGKGLRLEFSFRQILFSSALLRAAMLPADCHGALITRCTDVSVNYFDN